MSARAVAFDKTTGACSACQEVKDSPIVSCVTCNAHCHVSCYQPRATTSRQWMCDMCNENLADVFCHLCGHLSNQGIVRKLTTEEIQRLQVDVSKGLEGEPIYGHVFCLSFADHPQCTPLARAPKTRCDVCEKKSARLTCKKCPIAFHPFCALNGWGLLQHEADGHIVVACEAHRELVTRTSSTTKQISPSAASSSSSTTDVRNFKTERDSTDLKISPPITPSDTHSTSKPAVSSTSLPPPLLTKQISDSSAAASSIPKKSPIPKVAPPLSLINSAASTPSASTSKSTVPVAKKTPLNAGSSSSSSSTSHVAKAATSTSVTAKKHETVKQPAPLKSVPAKITAPSNPPPAGASTKAPIVKRKEVPANSEKNTQPLKKLKSSAVNFVDDDSSDDDDSSHSSTEMNRTLRTEASRDQKQKEALESIQSQHEQSKEFGDDCCQVCGEEWTYPDDGDELVGCDGPCQCWFHQSCYGIPDLPPDDEKFFCWPCKAKLKRGSVKCAICESTEGWGFVPVKYGNSTPLAVREAAKIKPPYAHVICVLWMYGTSFGDPVTRNPAVGIERIQKERFNLRCILCNNKKGAKIQCQEGECARAFHPLCMYRNKDTMYFDDHAMDDDILDNGKLVRPEKEYYCNHHSKVRLLKRERQNKIDANESTEAVDNALKRLEMLPVKPTTSIAPASKMVAVPGLKTGKRKRIIVEIDPADVEARAKKYQERVEETKMELAELEKEEANAIQAVHASKKQRLDLSHVTAEESDSEVESKSTIDSDIIMSDSEESTASNEARRRLKKARGAKQAMPKLSMSSTTSGGLSKAAATYAQQLSHSYNNYSNEQRDKVRNMFLEFQPRKVATSIEEALFSRHGNDSSNKAYVQQARDILSNLQSNEELSQQVFTGKVKAPELVAMSNEEMASDSLKAKRAEQHEQAIRESTAKQSQIIINRKDGELLTVDQTN